MGSPYTSEACYLPQGVRASGSELPDPIFSFYGLLDLKFDRFLVFSCFLGPFFDPPKKCIYVYFRFLDFFRWVLVLFLQQAFRKP